MINSIHNAVKVINCFTEGCDVGISDLAERLEMNKSTIHHIVKALYDEGVLVRTQSRKYRLGSQLLGWGHLVRQQYSTYFDVLPYMDQLVKATNETAHLAILENDQVSYLAKVEPKRPIRIQTKIGDRNPLHCTGLGKILLAYQPKEMINQFTENELLPRTPNTITEKNKLIEELERTRKRGYAIDDEEYEIGLFCIAAPITDFMGNIICAISLSGPEVRIREHQERLIQLLVQATKRISNQVEF